MQQRIEYCSRIVETIPAEIEARKRVEVPLGHYSLIASEIEPSGNNLVKNDFTGEVIDCTKIDSRNPIYDLN